jgi:Zn-dependent M28 family amino/carboxypeptidase
MEQAVRVLASDEFEGREPGTPAEDKTLAFITGQFAAAGLQPGNGGSWLQDVPLVEIAAQGAPALTVGRRTFASGSDWIGVTYREEPHTALRDSEVVFVGFGVVAPERGWDDYAGVDMRGKTALILVNDPDYDHADLSGPFGGRAMTYYGRWTYKFEEAARHGAAAALIVHDDYPAGYGWNVVQRSWSGPQGHAERGAGDPEPTRVNGWVRKGVAQAIVTAAGLDFAELAGAARQRGFRPVRLGVAASTAFDTSVRRFVWHNVVGVLQGRSRPGEYVLHTAHWDHLGHCTPNEAGDDICNGAIDNATGVAALIALAQAHVRAGPAARTLVFLALTGEESGLLGSEYYAAHPLFPLARSAGGLNFDGLYPTGPARDVSVIGGGKSELDAYLARALAREGRRATPDRSPEAGYYYRSDHFSLAKRGVPMFNLKSGQDLVDGGTAAGLAFAGNYRANAYHGPDDELGPAWDWRGPVADVRLAYRLGRMLAETRDWPAWLPGDEFRQVRERSCAADAGGC